ncbi:MAG TPA: hypothetical protein VFF78_00455, partial [Anaerolineaceae bacterium]|nr:hypothetical protein [Anaerolineaceae bacterium]
MKVLFLLFWFSLLVGCNSVDVSQEMIIDPPSASQELEIDPSKYVAEPPIILLASGVDGRERTELRFYCLNQRDCYEPVSGIDFSKMVEPRAAFDEN